MTLMVKRQALIAMMFSCVDLLSAYPILVENDPYDIPTDWTLDVDFPTFWWPLACDIEQSLVPATWTCYLPVLFLHRSSPLC